MSALVETVQQVLAVPGLWMLFVGVILAGLVRGFSGFGTAMIYMPFASMVLPPVWAVITILIFDIPGTLPIARSALRDCQPRELGRMAIGALLGLPVGLYFLSRVEPDLFRWLVSGISLLLLALLISGWRYQRQLRGWMTGAVGSLGGFLAGVCGLAGPPVILLYMSSGHAIKVIRANILLYLLITDITALFLAALMGMLQIAPILIGLLLTIPYGLANYAGAKLFRPDRERLFRAIAYGLIGLTALSNLPLFR